MTNLKDDDKVGFGSRAELIFGATGTDPSHKRQGDRDGSPELLARSITLSTVLETYALEVSGVTVSSPWSNSKPTLQTFLRGENLVI